MTPPRVAWLPIAAKAFLLAGALVPAGCVSTSPVERISQNTFTIRTHILGIGGSGLADAQAQNLRIATKYCGDIGRKATKLDSRSYDGVASQEIATFRCGDDGLHGRPAEVTAKRQ
jgi:hypothetical protein